MEISRRRTLSGGSTATYVYDALGRRVRRFTSGNVQDTKFTYEGDDVLLDDNSGTLTKYLNGEGIDNKLRSQTGTVVNYFLADHLGSTNGLADTSGSLTAQTAYDSFGNPSNTSFPNRYQFTGREFDNFTGLQFSRARWYDAKMGRFISEDRIGFAGGDINLYGYVWNSPMHLTDPLGLDGFGNAVAQFNETRTRSLQKALEVLEVPVTFTIGFGDTAGLGIPRFIRKLQGIDTVDWDCSTAYRAGGWAATAVDVVFAVKGAAKLAGEIAFRRALSRGAADTFKEFKAINGPAGPGMAWHHIVSQHEENILRFGARKIHNLNNVIKIPHGQGTLHAQVTGYYNSYIPGSKILVRDYVRTLSYRKQYEFGIEVLKRFGWTP